MCHGTFIRNVVYTRSMAIRQKRWFIVPLKTAWNQSSCQCLYTSVYNLRLNWVCGTRWMQLISGVCLRNHLPIYLCMFIQYSMICHHTPRGSFLYSPMNLVKMLGNALSLEDSSFPCWSPSLSVTWRALTFRVSIKGCINFFDYRFT